MKKMSHNKFEQLINMFRTLDNAHCTRTVDKLIKKDRQDNLFTDSKSSI